MKSFWAVNQSLPERGFNLAKYLGNLSNDPVEVVEFLRTVSAEDIAGAQTALLSQEANIFFLVLLIKILITITKLNIFFLFYQE